MGFHNLCSKCDHALAAYLGGADAAVYPAKRSLDKEIPCTVCYCKSASPVAPFSGTYMVKAEIQVKTAASLDLNQTSTTPANDSDRRVSETFDQFNLADDLNNAGEALAEALNQAALDAGLSDFTVLAVTIGDCEAGVADNGKGDVWVDTLNLEILCTAESGQGN